MADTGCVACGAATAPQHEIDGHVVRRCERCGLFALDVVAARHDPSHLERTEFAGALRDLRHENYAFILEHLERDAPLAGRKLLDVGCSSGWFLAEARRAGCMCYGIEPDAFFFEQARAAAPEPSTVAHGLFPRDVPPEWGRFDLITFHDVLEHLPEPHAVLRLCRDLLTADGRIVLSLPCADGFVFHIARGLARLGVRGPLARAFQVKYPYPHLYYFTQRSLAALSARDGFAVSIERLRAFSSRGALHRARMDRGAGVVGAVKAYANAAALVAFAAVEQFLPADNVLVILRPIRDGSK